MQHLFWPPSGGAAAPSAPPEQLRQKTEELKPVGLKSQVQLRTGTCNTWMFVFIDLFFQNHKNILNCIHLFVTHF